MTVQPVSEREQWLGRCEEQLARAKTSARAKQGRYYLVTRPVKGEPFTTTWTEGLVRWFLNAHRYADPKRWLKWAGEGEGTMTSFGWVRLKQSKTQEVTHGNQ